MRIVQVIPSLNLGGAEIMCENLIYELQRLGHSVIVISMFDNRTAITERLERAGIDIRFLDKKTGFDISMIWKIMSVLLEVRADAVHTHLYCTKYAIPAAVLAGVKHRVHTFHSIAQKENHYLSRKANSLFFRFFGTIPVALSNLVRETIMQEYGMESPKVPVIFNGIDLSKCNPKRSYSMGDKFRIIHVGRFCEAKNHPCLLKAFGIFHSKYPNSILQLVGDGEKRCEIEELIQNYNLQDSVELIGFQNNIFGFLHEADVFALTSLYEGMPMVLIEAMGTGLPIVATAVGGVPDMLDQSIATLTDIDCTEIAKAFEVYYLNEDLRKEHGTKAEVRSGAFSAESMAKKYLVEYGRIK